MKNSIIAIVIAGLFASTAMANGVAYSTSSSASVAGVLVGSAGNGHTSTYTTVGASNQSGASVHGANTSTYSTSQVGGTSSTHTFGNALGVSGGIAGATGAAGAAGFAGFAGK
jgi:hypothetical protein